MKYRREVDGLRAVAVLPVLLFHGGIAGFSGGFVGVDIFFVISGYLITTIIVEELDRGEFSLLNFYERRARRILPALFLVMACSAPFAWMLLEPGRLRDYSQSVVAVSAFASNILFWSESGYFAPSAELKPLLHTWSLAVEEQFYVIFPLMMMFLWRLGRRVAAGVIFMVWLASVLYSHWGTLHRPEAAFYLLPARFWEIATGSLIVLLLRRSLPVATAGDINDSRSSEALSGIGLALIVISMAVFDERTPFPGTYALVPTVGTALVLTFGDARTLVGRLLGHQALVGIGLVSYSVYLWHQPLLAFAKVGIGRNLSGGWTLLLLTLSIALGYGTWQFVEKPFRDRRRFQRRHVFGISGAMLMCFLAVALIGSRGEGLESLRQSPEQLRVLHTAIASPKRDECHAEGAGFKNPASACEYFGADVTWAMLGDSHAVELAYALALELEVQGVGIKHLSMSACEPSFRRVELNTACHDWTEQAVRYLSGEKAIRTVVVTYRINEYLFGKHVDGYPDLPNHVTPSRRQAAWHAYVDLLVALRAAGKDVILVLQAPELRMSATGLLFREDALSADLIGVPRSWWDLRQRFVRERLADIPTDVRVFDPSTALCDALNCYATRAGVSMYFDDNHLSVSGASLVAHELLNAMREVARVETGARSAAEVSRPH